MNDTATLLPGEEHLPRRGIAECFESIETHFRTREVGFELGFRDFDWLVREVRAVEDFFVPEGEFAAGFDLGWRFAVFFLLAV